MMELTINGAVYQFNAGIGFMRDANKMQKQYQNGIEKEVGLSALAGGLVDGDVEDLITTLDLMNKGQEPRATRQLIESYIENSSTDIDALFEKVIDFLSTANVSKKIMTKMIHYGKIMEEEQEKKMRGMI